MLLHDSRRDARVNDAGELVPLEEQDRSLWDRERISTKAWSWSNALSPGRVGPYQLQAAIAALHAEANRRRKPIGRRSPLSTASGAAFILRPWSR